MSTTLSLSDIDHIATLARLDLTVAEKNQYARELTAVLAMVSALDELDVSAVEETTQVTGLKNILREDTVQVVSEEDRKRIIREYPDNIGSLLKVQAVFADRGQTDE